jgi:hypothetical protein
MITEKTVFVLGAGASFPYRYPIGEALKTNICNGQLFKKIALIKNHIPPEDKHDIKTETFVALANKLVDRLKQSPDSIDLFLYSNPELSNIGKMAILLNIFHAERESISITECVDGGDWYSRIFYEMRRGFTDPTNCIEFGDNNVVFITFNYDRSLEHFFYNGLINSFEKNSQKEILETLNKIPIHHVYGKIAPFVWEDIGDINTIAIDHLKSVTWERFHKSINFKTLFGLKDNIKTIYERQQMNYDVVHDYLKDAKRVFFLGFGFADENMAIFRNIKFNKLPKIIATTLGLETVDTERAKQAIIKSFNIQNPKMVETKDMDCLTVLKNYLY